MQKEQVTKRRKVLLPIILLVFAALALFAFAACSDELTEDRVKEMGYVHAVTYDYNGGTVGGNDSMKLRVPDKSRIPEPGAGYTSRKAPTKAYSSFRYWCVAEKNEDGSLKYDEHDNLVPGKVWNFGTDTVTEDITLIAQWWDNYTMVLHYGNEYEHERVTTVGRDVNGDPLPLTTVAFMDADREYTFFGYYRDEQENVKIETVPAKFTKAEYESAEDNTIEVWGKSLHGTYSIISTADEFLNLSFQNGTNVYLNASFDMADATDKSKTLSFPESYNGEFVGNGYTISGITINTKPRDQYSRNLGMFGTLNARANIHDVTFEDVTVNITLDNMVVTRYNIGFLAGRAVKGAQIKNVNVSGTFNYEVTVGYNTNNITVDKVIGEREDGVVTEKFVCTDVTVNGTLAGYTKEDDYAVYVKYTQTPIGDVTITDVYGLATVNDRGVHREVPINNVVKSGDNYVITATNGTVYTVNVEYNAAGYFSSTVIDVDQPATQQ